MKHRQVESLLDKYIDGRLDPPRAADLAAHLESCSRCARLASAARALVSALSSVPPFPAPKGFRRRVMDEVYRLSLADRPPREDADRESRRGKFYRRLAFSFMVSAALLAVSLIVPRMLQPFSAGGLQAEGASMVKVTLLEADRLVRGTLEAPAAVNSGRNGGSR